MTYSGEPAQWLRAHAASATNGKIAGSAGFYPACSPDKPPPMAYRVAAFYQFASLPDFRELREPLRALCARLKLKGSVLLAHEGINGTLAGDRGGIAAFVAELKHNELLNGRLNALELKFSSAAALPFGRLKVRLKKEIVTRCSPEAAPTLQVVSYFGPA